MPLFQVTVIQGIMGILSLRGGDYLISITSKTKVATLNGHDIFKLTGFKILPITLYHRSSHSLLVFSYLIIDKYICFILHLIRR